MSNSINNNDISSQDEKFESLGAYITCPGTKLCDGKYLTELGSITVLLTPQSSLVTATSHDFSPTPSICACECYVMSFADIKKKKWKRVLVAQSCQTLCDPMDCSPPSSSVHGIFPGKDTGVVCHFLLLGIFLTQGSNLCLPHCRQIIYSLSQHGRPFAGIVSPQMEFSEASWRRRHSPGTSPAMAMPAEPVNLISRFWGPLTSCPATFLTPHSSYSALIDLLMVPQSTLRIPLFQGLCTSSSLVLECSSPWWLLGSHPCFTQVCSSITLAKRLSLLRIKKHPLLPLPCWVSIPFHCFIFQLHFIT